MQRVDTRARIRSFLVLLLMLVTAAGLGLAQQPLAAYTPAGSFLTVGFFEDEPVGTALKDDLASLDWAAAADTFIQLAEVMGTPVDLTGMLADAGGAALETCPAAAALFDGSDYSGAAFRGLFSVGFSPFNPLPATTMLLELAPDHTQLAEDALAALLGCAAESGLAEVHELDQDGSVFWQVIVDYELNLAISIEGGVLAVSSSADQLRQVLRLQAGSGEPSMADSRLYDTWQALERGVSGIDWMIDYAVLGDLAELFGAGLEAPELGSQLARSLRTAGGAVGSLSFADAELVWVNQSMPDAAGGDAPLFDLLLSAGLQLSAPPLLPEGGVLVSSQLLNVQGFFGYLQHWLDQLGPLIGEELDLNELAAMAGVDLDTVLLDWLGNEAHVVQLEPSFGLGSLLRGPSQLLMVAVTDPLAAETGFAELLELFRQFSAVDEEFDLGFDSRAAAWRGVGYTRLRVGPVTDLGYALLDGYLVVASPSVVLHRAIDLHLDGGSAQPPAVFSSGAELLSVQDYAVGSELGSAAAFIRSFTQPLAFVLRNAALEEAHYAQRRSAWDSSSQDWSWGQTYGSHDLGGQELQPLPLGQSATGVLNTASGAAYFELQGLNPGDSFSVRMESATGDSRIDLIERSSGNIVAYNDDYAWPALDAQIDFTALEGSSYVVRADFFGMSDSEAEFTVSLELQTAAERVEQIEIAVPSFAALLDMFDLVPQAIQITADRTGNLQGVQERRGDIIYSRYVLQADW